MSGLTEAWDQLRTVGEPDQYVRLRLADVSACAAYAAKRVGDGNEALMLEVSTTAIPARPDYPQSIGFEVRAEAIQPGRSGKTRLLLALMDQRFRDIFYSLAEDVILTLVAATSEAEAVRAFIARLALWQAFLRKHTPGGLTLEARRGLYGELSFLRDELLPRVDAITAVRAWKGCRGAIHDYQLPGGSVEVKTTSANPPRTFRVSKVGQLDDRGIPALFICVTVVDEAEAAKESLPELIDAIKEQLDAAALKEFNESLIESGFLQLHRDQYAIPRYSVVRKRYFRVSSGFPRIAAEVVPMGIEDVQYAVQLGACSVFEVDSALMIETIMAGVPSDE